MDVAAWTAAAGTLALAIVAGGSFRQGRSLIRAATDEASASRDLVTEMQRDRELQCQPVLSVRWPSHVAGTTGTDVPIELTNAGTGPAISCRYVTLARDPSPLELMTPGVDVPPGRTVTAHADLQLDRNETFQLCKWVDDQGFGHTSDTMGAIFAKDVLGHRYRFVVVKDSRQQPLIERVDRWLPGDPEPAWMSRDIWPDYGVVDRSHAQSSPASQRLPDAP